MNDVVLIPAYQPDEKLIELVKIIPKNMDIVVVDDGSGTDYAHIFKEVMEYAHVISYADNRGKGHALKTGIKYINEEYHDYVIVTVDCDGQHDVRDAMRLCDYAHKHVNTLVLGRRKWDETSPLRSRFGNAVTRLIFRLRTGISIYDTQIGLRAFTYKLTDYMLSNEGEGFEYEMNVLLNLRENKIKHHEMAIKTIYFKHNEKSHFKTLKDSYQIYKEIFKNKKN